MVTVPQASKYKKKLVWNMSVRYVYISIEYACCSHCFQAMRLLKNYYIQGVVYKH